MMDSYLALRDIKTKKVSFNMEVQVLELADELAKIIKTDRTTILMTLVGLGISPYMKILKAEWEKIKKSRPEKKTKIDELLKGLAKTEEKYLKREL